MSQTREERIRRRAREIWEANGRTGNPEEAYRDEATHQVDDELFGVSEPGQKRPPDPPASHHGSK